MKQVKFLMVALTILMGTMVTSCMNGNNESSYDGVAMVTVVESMGTPFLKVDNMDLTFTLTNPSLLQQKDGKYVERALVYYKFQEGVVYDPNVKKYLITIVQGQAIPVANFNLRPDTLKESFKVSDFSLGAITLNGGYLNVATRVNCNTYPQFEVYIDTAHIDKTKNLLPVILKYTKGGGTNYTIDGFNSWKLSNVNVGNEKIGLNTADSVVISVTAEGTSTDNLTRTVKYKFNY